MSPTRRDIVKLIGGAMLPVGAIAKALPAAAAAPVAPQPSRADEVEATMHELAEQFGVADAVAIGNDGRVVTFRSENLDGFVNVGSGDTLDVYLNSRPALSRTHLSLVLCWAFYAICQRQEDAA